jgi:DNA-binding transcriptional LysR family regulator
MSGAESQVRITRPFVYQSESTCATRKEILTPVLTDYPVQGPTLYAVYVSRKYLPHKIRAFIDFLTEFSARIPLLKLAEGR